MYRLFSEAVSERYILPLCIYAPVAGAEHHGAASINGIVFGATRAEVDSKLRYLQDRLPSSFPARSPCRAAA